MRIIASFLIALFAIIGISAAMIDHVEIISPHDGDSFSLGNAIKIRSMVSSIGDDPTFVRMFINNERVRTSNWLPTKAGEYTIMVEAADNGDFYNSIADVVTITVK